MMGKITDWIALKWSHMKDYAEPYTEKIQPAINNIKEYTDPYVDKAKDSIAPAIDNAKAKGQEMIEHGKEKARVAKEQRASNGAEHAESNDPPNVPNIKLLVILGVVIVTIVSLLVILLIGSGQKEDDPDVSATIDIGDIEENEIPTVPDVEDRGELKDENTRPTFTINGVEYQFGCQMSEVLNDMKIENIETYLHYNPKSLMIKPGKVREWAVCDDDGNKCYIEVYNPTRDELSSEHCFVSAVRIKSSEIGDLDVGFIGNQIQHTMQAKGIVDILGQVSGRDSDSKAKTATYWWVWAPYSDNADYTVYVKVTTNSETGEITEILVVDKTIANG